MNNTKQASGIWQLRIFSLFTLLGWLLIAISFTIGVFILAPTDSAYWGGNAKVIRDAAQAGSALLSQLQTLQVTPHWLEPLTFLGVASFILGIALEFSSIPRLLQGRADLMRLCIPLIVQKGD